MDVILLPTVDGWRSFALQWSLGPLGPSPVALGGACGGGDDAAPAGIEIR